MMRRVFLMTWLAGFLALSVHPQTNLWQTAKDAAAVHRILGD
jgi:hypothetical protein